MKIDDETFEQLVSEAIDSVPEEFRKKMHNVAILIEDFPSREKARSMKLPNRYSLFGLFEGYVQSKRLNFGPVLPDRITIFKMPILKSCSSFEACKKRIADTVIHEIAHHFGLNESGARKAERRIKRT